MAKRRPMPSLGEMEEKMGFTAAELSFLGSSDEHGERFYSDLGRVPESSYKPMLREYEGYQRKLHRGKTQGVPDTQIPDGNSIEVIREGQDTIRLERRGCVGSYRVFADVRYGFGLHLPLLLTTQEATRVLSTAKLSHNADLQQLLPTEQQQQVQPKKAHHQTSRLLALPAEIREQIYTLALPHFYWNIDKDVIPGGTHLSAGLGDPSGFYYPLRCDTGLLGVSRQVRREALPLAYRKASLQVADLDDLVRFLVAVGETGRANIETLAVRWQSRSDSERGWELETAGKGPVDDGDRALLALPSLHAVRVGQLLGRCTRLSFLRVCFEEECLRALSLEEFKADPGIRGLCTVRGIRKVDIGHMGYGPLEEACELASWLKTEMESRHDA